MARSFRWGLRTPRDAVVLVEKGNKIVPPVASDNTAGMDVTAGPEDAPMNIVGTGAIVVNGSWKSLDKKVADSVGRTLLSVQW